MLLTPGGFVEARGDGRWSGSKGWNTTATDVDVVRRTARGLAVDLIDPRLLDEASGVVANLLLGVDVYPTSKPEPHAEFAIHCDLADRSVGVVTGKSYPTGKQERQLIRDADIDGHMMTIGGHQTAVLVCHDLAAWSPRGMATRKGTRAKVGNAFAAAITAGRPTLALHLPHTLDTAKTWGQAWGRLRDSAGPQLACQGSAIRDLTKGWGEPDAHLDAGLLDGTARCEDSVAVVLHDPEDWPVGRATDV